MENNLLENLKLEIIILQKKDYQNALDHGFTNKKEWYNYIINSSNDEIAEAIIQLASRYDVLPVNVANIFDSSMIMRVGKIVKEKNNLITK
ncbi:MAG: hypothetical protein PHX04_03445 [Bacilli bacterium]|nr:hypothetical protein [Bacilli bacterium]